MEKKKKKIKAHRIGTCGTFCSNCKKSDARAFNQYIKYCWFCGAEFDIKNWRFQRKVKTLTNEQKIRDKISTIEGLADYLVSYNDNYGEFYTSDCESFETKGEAVQHEIEWLKEEYNELW